MESKAQKLKALQTVFVSLLLGQVLFLVVAFILVSGSNSIFGATHEESLVLLIDAIVSVGVLAFCFFNCLKKIQSLATLQDAAIKFGKYRNLLILQSALCEGAVLFTIISYMLTGNQYMLFSIFTIWAYLLTQYPTKNKLIQQLDLSSQEAASM